MFTTASLLYVVTHSLALLFAGALELTCPCGHAGVKEWASSRREVNSERSQAGRASGCLV